MRGKTSSIMSLNGSTIDFDIRDGIKTLSKSAYEKSHAKRVKSRVEYPLVATRDRSTVSQKVALSNSRFDPIAPATIRLSVYLRRRGRLIAL